MFIAHGPLSYILNEQIQKKEISELTKGEHISIALLSIFFGILPDFDLFLLSMTDIPTFQHHQVYTHSILFWVVLWLILQACIYILKRVANSKTRNSLSNTFLSIVHKAFLIGVMSHLFADILFSHSQVFLPFSNEVTILGDILSKNYFSGSIFTVSMAVEILVLSLFLFFVYKSFLKKSKLFEYIVYVCIFLSFSLILFTTYISLNTYNRAKYIQDGKITYDEDFDTLIDYKDPDTDNDGRDNIQSIEKYTLARDIRSILEGKYITSAGKDIYSKVTYRYGGLTSYRLISQAFFNQNMAVEPVLRNFAQREYNIREYTFEYEYPDLLYNYFKHSDSLRDFDVNVSSGNIFFVLDNEENIVNMGVVLDNTHSGIVLDDDKRTKIHTLQEIFNIYSEYILKVQTE